MKEIELCEQQQKFIHWFLGDDSGICLLTGHAGSGKTTVIGRLVDVWKDINIMFCAPTHQAASVLSNKLDGRKVYTLQSVLGIRRVFKDAKETFVPSGRHKITMETSLIVIDEASMVSPLMLQLLLSYRNRKTKILFVGDPAQIPPVGLNSSPVFDAGFNTFHLTSSHRQADGSPIIALADEARNSGMNIAKDVGISEVAFNKKSITSFFNKHPEGVILTATNKLKDYCNQVAREFFCNGKEHLNAFECGDVLVLSSPIEPPYGVNNGERVFVISNPFLDVFMGFKVWKMLIETSDHTRTFNIMVADPSEIKNIFKRMNEYHQICINDKKTTEEKVEANSSAEILSTKIISAAHGFAMTIHKSQGSTYNEVMLCTKDINQFFKIQKMNMIYTGLTRAASTLVLSK